VNSAGWQADFVMPSTLQHVLPSVDAHYSTDSRHFETAQNGLFSRGRFCCTATREAEYSSGVAMAAKTTAGDEPVVIKKYANRRLYDTATSSYITLEDLCQMVQDGTDFVVYDAKSGADITRSVLTQIIVEEEQKGQNLLPIGFLRQLISFYGDNMQWLVPRYLEFMMQSFAENQSELREHVEKTFGNIFPANNLEELSRQNMALFERTMRMFNPFAEQPPSRNSTDNDGAGRPEPSPRAAADNGDSLNEMRRQLEAMQKQLDALSKEKGG
jgi:polyhydroxyalkanoate synthesis repressor PhaR